MDTTERTNVVNLRDRLKPVEVREYQRAAIASDVCVVTLIHALNTHGLTLSNDLDLGLVIHRIKGGTP